MESIALVQLAPDQFLHKILEPEGFMVLIEDFSMGRYELHVYRPRDMVAYVTERLYVWPRERRDDFVRAVDVAAMRRPSDIKRYQW